MNRSNRAPPDAGEPDEGPCPVPHAGSAAEAMRVLSLVHRQLDSEGRLSVPRLAREIGICEGAVLNALTELHHRGWLEPIPDAPYFRVTPGGRAARQP